MAEKSISQKLLEMLRCPACDDRPQVELKGGNLVCPKCGQVYEVENGIPAMLVEETE